MNTVGKLTTALLLTIAAFTSGAFGASPYQPDPGQLAPDFTLTDLNGQRIQLSDYRGKVVLLDFWATWCAPCVAELPDILKTADKTKDKGVVIVGVSLDDADKKHPDPGQAKLKAFVAEHEMHYPVVSIDARFDADYGKVLAIPGDHIVGSNGLIQGLIPSMILIDRSGRISGFYIGSLRASQALADTIKLAQ